jgi:hypothetical protein
MRRQCGVEPQAFGFEGTTPGSQVCPIIGRSRYLTSVGEPPAGRARPLRRRGSLTLPLRWRIASREETDMFGTKPRQAPTDSEFTHGEECPTPKARPEWAISAPGSGSERAPAAASFGRRRTSDSTRTRRARGRRGVHTSTRRAVRRPRSKRWFGSSDVTVPAAGVARAPDRTGPAARVGKANVDGLAGPPQGDRVDVFLAVHSPLDPGHDRHRRGQRVLRHPGPRLFGDRLGIPRRARPPATLAHTLMLGRGTDKALGTSVMKHGQGCLAGGTVRPPQSW